MKFLNIVLIAIMCVLGFFSVIALIAVHSTLMTQYSFTLKPDGLIFYLSQVGHYKELFAGTITVIAAFFGLHRLNAAIETNILKIKSDRFAEWKLVLEARLPEAEVENPYMRREFIRVRYNFYESLNELTFRIENREQLTTIFQRHFQDLARFFEDMNEKHMHIAAYPNNNYAFSFDSFRFVFVGCADYIYNGAVADLLTLYVAQIDPARMIDQRIYTEGQNNYRRRVR